MAKVFRLATESAGTTYDFLTGTLRPMSWSTRPAGNGMVVDTLMLRAVATDANILVATAAIDNFIQQAMLFNKNKKIYESVWLDYNSAAENAKRYFVTDIRWRNIQEGKFSSQLLGHNAVMLELTITRSEVGEDTATAAVQDNGTTTMGDTVALAAITGALPARIEWIRFTGVGGVALSTFWAGIRPTNHGTTFYLPVWDIEDGTLGTDTSKVADGGASGGNVAQVSFATNAAMVERASMTVLQRITPETAYDDMIGRYHILCRAKVGAGTTVNLQVKSGYASSTNFDENEIYYGYNDTDYRFLDLGLVEIPPFSYRAAYQAANLVKNFEIQVHAQRTAGSNQVDIDCIVLMPADHFTYSTGSSGGTDASTVHYTNEDGETLVLGKNGSGEPDIGVIGVFNNWEYPLEGGTLVICAERSGSSINSDTFNTTVTYIKRYLMHREA